MKLFIILVPLLWVLCCSSVSVDAAFLSLVLPTSPNLTCSANTPPATGCLYVSTQTAYCFGQTQVTGQNKLLPTLIRYNNGTKVWCRGLLGTGAPYSAIGNSTIYGAGYDTTTGTLWIIGSVDAPDSSGNSWSNFTFGGFQENYGSGSGQVVSVVAVVNTVVSFLPSATFLRAISINGTTNSLRVTELGLSQDGNLIVYADSADLPPGLDGAQPIPSNCVSYSAPLKWTAELTSDLSQVAEFCIDPAKYVAASGCFENTCPGTSQETTVATQDSDVIVSNISANAETTFYSKENLGSSFTYKLTSLIERDSSGEAVKTFEAFSGLQFTAVSNDSTTFQGIPAKQVTLTTDFPISNAAVSIQVDYYVFLGTGSVTWGSQTFNVGPDTLKTTVTLSNWPFASTSNTLELQAQGVTSDGDVAWDDATKTGTFSSGAKMVFATSAKYDDSSSNAEATVTGSVSGLTLSVLINFNSFTTSVAYDPQLVVGEESNGSSAASQLQGFWF